VGLGSKVTLPRHLLPVSVTSWLACTQPFQCLLGTPRRTVPSQVDTVLTSRTPFCFSLP
jgi:hypothetical protein